jgi:hypothetical protein
MLIDLLDLVLRPLLRAVNYDVARLPRWLVPLVDTYVRGYVGNRLLPRIVAADLAGKGQSDAEWPAGTPVDTMLEWFDEELAATPRVGVWDVFRMRVVQARSDELDLVEATGVPLPPERLRCHWVGTRQQWWSEGREQIAQAIEGVQGELYTVADGVGTTILAALCPDAGVV